ncbi:glycosyltransferase family 4 protein [Niabella aurantiaca]|uniref:glycosyltransferase family 4 protein n=1 Tax=Niabella aurantiaca TaxID=379900 RepID=UPI00036809C9|nr:glycosyltransferase family 4 protein [Niabella aurantiaca]
MNILIFFPYNQISVEQQSVMKMLKEKRHNVTLLTLTPWGPLHDKVCTYGIEAFSTGQGEVFSIKRIRNSARMLKQLCSEQKIDLLLVHQQLCAIVLILAGRELRARAFYFRHNTDEDYNKNYFKAFILNRFINTFIKKFVAPSDAVYRFLLNKEGVPADKIQRINYGYDFDLYGIPDIGNVNAIKEQYSCKLLVISIARFVEAKRHREMFEVIHRCIVKGYDIKMICLGDGALRQAMEEEIKLQKLEDKIFLLGRKSNVLDYLTAADVLLHLSDSEASNSVAKEAALCHTPAIVCEDVGDFSDYIVQKRNGFLVDKNEPVAGAAEILYNAGSGAINLNEAGDNAYQSITAHFSINNVQEHYQELIDNARKY